MNKATSVKSVFSVRFAILLQLLNFGVFAILAAPLFIMKALGFSLSESLGLTLDTFFIFVLIAQFIAVTISWVVIHKRIKRNNLRWSHLGFTRFKFARAFLYVIGFYILMVGFIFALASLTITTGINATTESSSFTIQRSMGLWPSIIIAVIAAPILEEVLFRGILFRRLLEKHNLLLSVILGGSIFAILHLNPFQAIAMLPMGIYLCIMYHRLGSIIPGIILHASWNLLVTLIAESGL